MSIFLTATEFGLWGLILISVTTLLWFKDVGVSDKFIQQDEEDQETAFQKAFTLNLLWTGFFFVLIVLAVPVFSLLYGRPDTIVPALVLALVVPGTALQSPTWIFYREMRFARQRTLTAIDPCVALVVTIALGAAGAGYWSLIIGGIAGSWLAAAAALYASPYPIRLRYDPRAAREYFSFSWPLFVSTGTRAIVVLAAVFAGKAGVGLAGLGAIGLAGSITRFADRVDQVLTQTIYPAVCAVRDRTDLLFEAFTKSNRLALMWGLPFGAGLALFGPDLVEYVLGRKWELATGLIQVLGVLAGVQQLAFNWTAFQRALDKTRPMAVSGALSAVTFLAIGVPLTLTYGLPGYAIGFIALTLVELGVRTYFLSQIFTGFGMFRHSLRAIAPTVPAIAAVLLVRALVHSPRSLGLALVEVALYVTVTAVATWFAERTLLRELAGYLRPRLGVPNAA